ncbi:MAG: aldehyde ferredoxin oxidoreductase, partial [Anaerolineae bacterium]|nr:aldehyde ferredoxin oxidoreductase [Anaerolineae bacterium]
DSSFTSEDGIADIAPLGILEPLPFDDLSAAKMRLAAIEIPWRTMNNVLDMCMFVSSGFTRTKMVEAVAAITGWETSMHELLLAGERAYTMARLFNLREGFTAADDVLPQRFFEPFEAGPSKGNALPPETFAEARKTLYLMLGWNADGTPLPWKLQQLGISWALESQ